MLSCTCTLLYKSELVFTWNESIVAFTYKMGWEVFYCIYIIQVIDCEICSIFICLLYRLAKMCAFVLKLSDAWVNMWCQHITTLLINRDLLPNGVSFYWDCLFYYNITIRVYDISLRVIYECWYSFHFIFILASFLTKYPRMNYQKILLTNHI